MWCPDHRAAGAFACVQWSAEKEAYSFMQCKRDTHNTVFPNLAFVGLSMSVSMFLLMCMCVFQVQMSVCVCVGLGGICELDLLAFYFFATFDENDKCQCQSLHAQLPSGLFQGGKQS